MLLIFLAFAFLVAGADTGFQDPGTMATDSAAGDTDWTNPDNAKTTNNAYAVTEFSGEPFQSSYYLKATNFGFALPAGSTIDGVEVRIERKDQAFEDETLDDEVKLIKGGTIQGDDKKSATNYPTSDTYASYGGAADKWSVTLSETDVEASNFGVTLRSTVDAGGGDNFVDVDHIEMKIYYTEVSDTCTPPASGNYAVDCSDNCQWSGADTIPGNITMTGSGANVLSAAWTFTSSNQWINMGPGCEFDIASGGEFK